MAWPAYTSVQFDQDCSKFKARQIHYTNSADEGYKEYKRNILPVLPGLL
jgi:hypothetical protein